MTTSGLDLITAVLLANRHMQILVASAPAVATRRGQTLLAVAPGPLDSDGGAIR